MGNILSGIWVLIKNGPAIYKILKEIVQFLQSIYDYVEQKEKMEQLKKAIQKAKETGNTKELEDMFKNK